MSRVVYQGAKAPEAYVLNLTPGTSGVDLSTVTAASLVVRLPGGTETTWSATRSNQTTSTLKLTHTFDASGTETATPGEYVVVPELTVPSGVVRCEPQPLTVRGKFEVVDG